MFKMLILLELLCC